MDIFARVPNIVKGIILVIIGLTILFDALGIATELLHTIVLIGSIIIIIFGLYMMNFHHLLYALFGKKEPISKQEPFDHNKFKPND